MGKISAKECVNVRLADGSVVLAAPWKGGWMGPTDERPYPDFEVVPSMSPMSNGIQPSKHEQEEQDFAEAVMAAEGKNKRISREQMFFEVAQVLRKRSTCLRGKVGCVIVRDRRIVSQGYNGAPPNMPHCFELGCDVDENNHEAGCQRTVHAEANAIVFAAKHGVPIDGTVLWCTHGPCLKCAQLIITAGIVHVHYITPYRLPGGLDLLMRAGVDATQHAF